MDELIGMFFAILLGAFVATLVVIPINAAERDYYARIERKYDIHVVDEISDYIVYNNGKCVALKLPYDELKRIGCGEFSEKLSD